MEHFLLRGRWLLQEEANFPKGAPPALPGIQQTWGGVTNAQEQSGSEVVTGRGRRTGPGPFLTNTRCSPSTPDVTLRVSLVLLPPPSCLLAPWLTAPGEGACPLPSCLLPLLLLHFSLPLLALSLSLLSFLPPSFLPSILWSGEGVVADR